ncbi:hypothetical protein L3X38_037798 [Prunus dulcis]|uniref:Uncharacterized protein n=1 Tax=Prunus dulcis TaxID=3755 RepID=A0AAD4V3U2_PRUDU|nr:hypothetical protein L3X38_037798 [Prunus dulcis]
MESSQGKICSHNEHADVVLQWIAYGLLLIWKSRNGAIFEAEDLAGWSWVGGVITFQLSSHGGWYWEHVVSVSSHDGS